MRSPTQAHLPEAAFHVLADSTRRAVLDLLREGSLAAGEIAQRFPVSRPAISRHLRLLRRARLVAERRSGRHRLYRLNPKPLRAVDQWLEHYRVFWSARLAGLKAYVESQSARRSGPRPHKARPHKES